RQRLLHLGAGTVAEGQRNQSADRRQAGHQNGTKPRAARDQERFLQRHSARSQLADVFDQNDAVLDVQPDQENRAHERRDIERRVGNPQGEQRGGQRNRLGQKNQQRQDDTLEL